MASPRTRRVLQDLMPKYDNSVNLFERTAYINCLIFQKYLQLFCKIII